MKFYDRIQEIETLREIEAMSAEYAQMTMMVGRRLVGKRPCSVTLSHKRPCFISSSEERMRCCYAKSSPKK